MDGIIDIKNEVFMRLMDDLQKTIKRYEKFPPEQRFLMLTDKLILMVTFAKTAMTFTTETAIKNIEKTEGLSGEQKTEKITQLLTKYDKVGNLFELVKSELNALEDFIQSDSKSILNNMESKLDEVLLGPYYAAGKELMTTAGKDFDSKKN